MSDSREWPFNTPDLLKIPFIFVPDGDPEPTEWLASHPDAIRIRARFVPTGTAGTNGGGAIQADLNEAMMRWLGRAAGDDGGPATQPDQDGGQLSPEGRLADLLAANATAAGAGNLFEMNLNPALTRFLYRKGDDGAAPGSQPGLEAQLAVWLAANDPGGGEGSPTGTTFDPALMKFILGTYADPAALDPQVDREPGGVLPGTWLADWRPSQNSPQTDLPDPLPSDAISAAHKARIAPADPGPKKMTSEEMLKLARMRAMLRLIKWDENGPVSDDKAYHARLGGHDPMSDKDMVEYRPKLEKARDKRGKLHDSTAAGAYQIGTDTWQWISDTLGITDFTPANQDRGALLIIDSENARSDIEMGFLPEAINKLNHRWVSLSGGSQTQTSLEADKKIFDAFVIEELKRIEDAHNEAKP